MPAPNQTTQSQQFAMQTPCTMMFVNSYEEIEGILRDVNQNMNAGFQKILDTMCQDKIADLQRQLSDKNTQIAMLNLKADNLANTDTIVANNEAQTAILRQALNPTPVPAYPAQYPSWNNCGCGNNNNYCCA